MIVTAIDPGYRWTAVVTRDTSRGKDDSVLAWRVIDAKEDLPDRQPLTIIAEVLEEVREQILGVGGPVHDVAVEGVNGPTGFAHGKRSPLDPSQLLVTAAVMGAVVGAFSATVVDPAGHGAPLPGRAALLAVYPVCLVGARERTGGGKAITQHARAAWDVAGAAARLHTARGTRTA